MPSFYAYINKEAVKKKGIDIHSFCGPYDVFNSGLDTNEYAVFPIDIHYRLREEYDNNPKFKKIIVSSN